MRTYTLSPTAMYGGRREGRDMFLRGFSSWDTKRVGWWNLSGKDYAGAVSFYFDFSAVQDKTIQSIKLKPICSGSFAYSVPILYNEKSVASTSSWEIPNYAYEVQCPKNGTIPQIDVTVFGIPDYGYVLGGYYRTYAYVGITGATLTIVTAETSKTVTYNANGGENTPTPTEIWGEGSWIGNVTSSVPARTGYAFEGWNTQANGGGDSYDSGDQIEVTEDITLYAQWRALYSTLDSATDANITEATTVSWTNYGAFTNKLRFMFGSFDSGEIAVTGDEYQYTLPSSWYSQTPSAVSGTATVYLYTYIDGVLIGTSSMTFTASVKSTVVPTIGSMTATPVDQLWGLYLQKHSSVTIGLSGCTAGDGAAIASYTIVGEGMNYSESTSDASVSYTSDVFAVSGSLTYTATIKDTRGRTATQTVTITVTAYSEPSISSVTAYRCNSDGTENPVTGTSIKAVAVFTFSQVGQNALTSTLSYKRISDQYYTQAQTGLASGQAYIIAVGVAEISSSYNVQVEISDSLYNSATYTIIVPPVVGIAFGLNNDRARFGGPVEAAGLRVDWDADFRQDVQVRGDMDITGDLTGGGVVKTVNSTAPDASGNVNVNGGGTVKSVNSIQPDSNGDVQLSASDVDALPDTYTPPVTSVNGKTGAVSLTPNDIQAIPLSGGDGFLYRANNSIGQKDLCKTLWSGTGSQAWSSGTLTVDGLSDYTIFLVRIAKKSDHSEYGSCIFAAIGGEYRDYFRGTGAYASNTTTYTQYFLSATLMIDTLTFGYCFGHTSGGTNTNAEVTEIIGIV